MPQPERTRADVRKDLLERLRLTTGAWSVNGRDVSLTIDFDLGAEVGGFLAVTTPGEARLLVQIQRLALAVKESVQVDVDLEGVDTGGAAVRNAQVAITVRFVEGDGVVLGAITDDGLTPSPNEGFSVATVELATDAEVELLVAGALGSSAGLEIGRLGHADVSARLRASGFARHTFLCGQSGSGKTYSMGVLLERLLLETDLPLVVIDPNSDYISLGTLRTREDLNRHRAKPLTRAAHTAMADGYRAQARVVVARASGGDLPLRIHLSDLTLDEQALTLGLDPIADGDEFAAYFDATKALAGGPYGITQIEAVLTRRFDPASRRLAQRIDNLGIGSWSVWADVDEPSLTALLPGNRAAVLDTGSLADARERSVVALALFGTLRRRTSRSPISIVIDEAHNVCSPDAATALERAVAGHAVWIAGEGRKFGLYLILATQRPQKVDRNVISQCDNLLLMRVNSATDLDELSEIFSYAPATMIAEARSFQQGEMLAAGAVAPTPIRLRVGERWTPEGGADLPATWAVRRRDS